jgi:hypothetical protein
MTATLTPLALLLTKSIELARETNKALWLAECKRLEESGYDAWLDEINQEDLRLEAAAGDALEVEEVDPLVLPKWVSRMNDFSMFTDEEVELLESGGRYGVANEG